MFEFGIYLYCFLFISYFFDKPRQFTQKISNTQFNWVMPYKSAEAIFFPIVYPFLVIYYFIKFILMGFYQKTQKVFHTDYRPLVLEGLEKELARQYDKERTNISKRKTKGRNPEIKVVKRDPGKRKTKTTAPHS